MFRPLRQCAWPVGRRPLACPSLRRRESRVAARAPAETRQFLPAKFLAVGIAADAFRRRQFMVGAPGEQPGLHVLAANVVTRFYLTVRLPDFGQHSLLVSHVGLDGVGNQKVRAAAGSFGQLGQTLLRVRFQANTKGSAPCVPHEHIVARPKEPLSGCPTSRGFRDVGFSGDRPK